jgi:hypothetical protein
MTIIVMTIILTRLIVKSSRLEAKSGTKALKQANSTSLDKQLSTNLPTRRVCPFSEFWPRCGYEKAYEGDTGVVLPILGRRRTQHTRKT